VRLDRLVALAQSALAAPAASFQGAEAYPELTEKAAVLAWHLIRNHPLPDGNKRMGYLALLEFVARNSRSWRIHPAAEEDETVALFEGIAAGDVSRDELRAWLEKHLG
jgi:death-on-curing protein